MEDVKFIRGSSCRIGEDQSEPKWWNFMGHGKDLWIQTSDVTAANVNVIEKCCTDIKSWMTYNFMKLNTDKTEVLVVGTTTNLKKVSAVDIDIGGHCITSSKLLKNLGVIFDCNLNMQSHIRMTVSRNAYYHLHNISKIKKYLNYSVTEQVITMLVMSKIDYCNALFAGLPQSTLAPLQRVQNSAARIFTGTRKFEHITPVLMKLHWLPVNYRIMYKICLISS